MKNALLSTLLLVACVNGGSPNASADSKDIGSDGEGIVAIENVNVIPMTGDGPPIVEGATVLIEGDRIAAVGRGIAVSTEARTIDGSNMYLIPGLAEMHGHVPPPSADSQRVEDTLFLYLANGITTVRGMLGAPGQLELREATRSGEIIGPNLYLAGPSFNGGSVSSPEQAIEMVREQHEEGWDLLKVHPGLTRAEYDAMADTANELGIRFGGHVPAEVGLLHALEKNQETFDHLDGFIEQLGRENLDEQSMRALARKTREAGAWVVPTMALWETLLGTADLDPMLEYDELRYVSDAQVRQWVDAYERRKASPDYDAVLMADVARARIDMLRILHEEGVPVLMGTDAPQQFSVPGFSLHRELEWMTRAGMSPEEILTSGTVNVGLYFANEDRFGSIAPDQRADLVLLRQNPLEGHHALSAIEGVMVRGRWLSRDAIDERLAAIDARNE